MFSVLSLIRHGETMQAIVFILSACFVVFVCTPIHEFAHGFVAYKLGDKTAKNQGRLTINPLVHIDLIGMIMILLFGFGYAKPVPVNMRYFKNPKVGMALVGAAGPISNLIMAFVNIFIYYFLASVLNIGSVAISLLVTFFYFAAYINVSLAVFNLLPIPPLDGSKIIAGILPKELYYKYMQYERYVMIAVIILLFTGIIDGPLYKLDSFMMWFISIIPRMIFGMV